MENERVDKGIKMWQKKEKRKTLEKPKGNGICQYV